MSEVISVSDLIVRYRQRRGGAVMAVDGLSFSVRQGEIVGFLGPNGAGKSSTIKALMGFLSPVSGQCEVLGHTAGSVEAKRKVGYLPEVALYYPFLTPLETLCLYGELQGLSGKPLREQAAGLLERLGLGASMKNQNRTLSKGMLQRVGIAQSLLGDPELLVLDEVTGGLDPLGRQELRALLRERRDSGCTLFFSSHELSEVETICDRILVIHRGRLVEERRLDSLRDELRDYALVYEGGIDGEELGGQTWKEGRATRARFASKNQLLAALNRVQASGGTVFDVVSQEGSLEDYFVETIRRAA